MKHEQTADDSGRWEIETTTRPGTPRAKVHSRDDDRIVTGPGVYSDVFEDLGPLVIRQSKY